MGNKKRKHYTSNFKNHTNKKEISHHCDACGHHVPHWQLKQNELHNKAVNNLKAEVTKLSKLSNKHSTETTKLSNKHSIETTKLKKDIAKLRQSEATQRSVVKAGYNDYRSALVREQEDHNVTRQKLKESQAELQKARRFLSKLEDQHFELQSQLQSEESHSSALREALSVFQAEQAEAVTKSKEQLKEHRVQQARVLAKQRQQFNEFRASTQTTKKRKNKTAVADLKKALIDMEMPDDRRVTIAALLLADLTGDDPDSSVRADAVRTSTNLSANAVRQQKFRDKTKLDPAAVEAYFNKCEPEEVKDFLPPAFISLLQTEGAASFSSLLSIEWSYLIGAFLLDELQLSRRKYNQLRNVLFKRYNKTTGKFERLVLMGVTVPLPPSYSKIKKWRKAQLDELDLEVVPLSGGTAAALDVQKALSVSLNQEIGKGHFKRNPAGQLVSALSGSKPIVQVSFDAAHTCRGRKTTAFAIKFVNGAFSNTYKYCHCFAILEGGDDHASISSKLGDVIAEVNRFVNEHTIPNIVDGGGNADVDVYATADQAAVHACHGLCGSDHKFSCPFCHCPNTNFSKPAEGAGFQARTLEQLQLLAHVREGFCPGCEMHIVKTVTDPGTQMPLVTPEQIAKGKLTQPKIPQKVKDAATAAAKANKSKAKFPTWNQLHFGKRFGVEPLLLIEPSLWAICILHCNLRIVGTMFKKTVFENLTNKPGDLKRASELYLCLLSNSIPVDRVSQTSNNVEDYYDSISKHGFAGEDCTRLLLIYPQLLAILFPPEERSELGRTDKLRLDHYYAVWQYWAKFLWPLINKKTVQGTNNRLKADDVKTKAEVFCGLWQSAFGVTPTLYLHLLSVHLPEQILNFPADPAYFSLQGLEHCNKRRKAFKKLTNCHKVTKEVHVDEYVNKNGKVVQAHTKSSGPTMCTQLLELILVTDITNSQFYGEEDEQRALETNRKNNKKKLKSIATTCM